MLGLSLTSLVETLFYQEDWWRLPLTHDDPLQPLYDGPPLPLAVLNAVGLSPDDNGAYGSCDPDAMAMACRHMAAWKLAGNGIKVNPLVACFLLDSRRCYITC